MRGCTTGALGALVYIHICQRNFIKVIPFVCQHLNIQFSAFHIEYLEMASLLLKGGTALIHDADDHVKALKTDILIEGNKIAKIEPEISALPDVEVIDCTDKIISPGFVDTHHHVWQTQLKGRHADQLLLDYMVTGTYKPTILLENNGSILECLHI